MRRSSAFLASLMICFAAPVLAEPPEAVAVDGAYPDTTPIARTFFYPDIRRLLVMASRSPYHPLPQEMASCLRLLSPDETSGMMAGSMASVLTQPEATDTLQFLASAAGQKYAAEQRTKGATKPTLFNPNAGFSSDDLEALRAFANTSAGRKLIGNLERLPGARDAMMSAVEQALLRCGSPTFFTGPEGEGLREHLRQIRQAPLSMPPASHINVDPNSLPGGHDVLGCTAPHPTYPSRAWPLRGISIVKLTIGEDGRVLNTTITQSSGIPALDDAAEAGVKAMRCKPYMQEGKAIKVVAAQPINFEPE